MRQFVLLALFAVCFVGCRTPTTDPTETVVTGEVLLDGKALTMGEVYFENESGTKSGLGDINADGKIDAADGRKTGTGLPVRLRTRQQHAKEAEHDKGWKMTESFHESIGFKVNEEHFSRPQGRS